VRVRARQQSKEKSMKVLLLFLLIAAHAAVASAQAPSASGEVTRVNTRTKEITIRHEPIPHLDMGRMTMAFPVKNPAMLDRVKPGDKVQFTAEKVGNEAIITKIEVSK
jgi:Cu(I)/Ag(I) efflux system periplasmic protein CusF